MAAVVVSRLAGYVAALYLLLPAGKATAFLGLQLAVFGVLLVFDQLTSVTRELQTTLDRAGLDWLVNLG